MLYGHSFSKAVFSMSKFPKRKEQLIAMQGWNLGQLQYCFSSSTVKSGPSGDPAGYCAIDHVDHAPDHQSLKAAACVCVCLCMCVCMYTNQRGSWPCLTLLHSTVPYSTECRAESRQIDKGGKKSLWHKCNYVCSCTDVILTGFRSIVNISTINPFKILYIILNIWEMILITCSLQEHTESQKGFFVVDYTPLFYHTKINH